MIATIFRLTITLEDTDPPIWRRVEVAAEMRLRDLHEVIQAVMGLENSHLYQFEIGGALLEGPGLGMGSAAAEIEKCSVAELMGQGIEQFRYVYDMGDDWGHAIQIEPAPAADSNPGYPHFIEGKGRCPPEDVGSVPGFHHFLQVMRNRRHPEYRELALWHGAAFDPKNIDTGRIRRRLKELAPRSASVKRPV